MKSFSMIRNGQLCPIIELGFWDMVKLAIGVELLVMIDGKIMVVRNETAYAAFNLTAPEAK